jgi:hypothetical protein
LTTASLCGNLILVSENHILTASGRDVWERRLGETSGRDVWERGDGRIVLTLKAAGLVDIDAGEIVRPGILRIDGDRIVGVGGGVDKRGLHRHVRRALVLDGLLGSARELTRGAGTLLIRERYAPRLVEL